MKLHWGHYTAIFFSTFVAFMLFMVYKCTQQNFELVTADYYDQEINYQERINEQQNALALTEKPSIQLNNNMVEISIPSALQTNGYKGEITLFRPSDATLDKKYPVQLNEQGKQYIPLANLNKGVYEVQLKWNMQDKNYYYSDKIYVQ